MVHFGRYQALEKYDSDMEAKQAEIEENRAQYEVETARLKKLDNHFTKVLTIVPTESCSVLLCTFVHTVQVHWPTMVETSPRAPERRDSQPIHQSILLCAY